MTQSSLVNIPKIIGHRGVKDLAPENTLESITKAISLGIKWVEIDVKISKDFIPFLLHDDELNRTTNGKGIASDYEYNYIRTLDAGSFFYKRKTNIYPPTLEEVLKLCKKNQCGLNIELKPNLGLEADNVNCVLQVVKKLNLKIPILYSSFNFESCILIKENNPNNLCSILIDSKDKVDEAILLINKYNIFACGVDSKYLNEELIKVFKDQKILIMAFSDRNINLQQAKFLWNLGVDSIFVDKPI